MGPIVFATSNRGKIAEARARLALNGIELQGPDAVAARGAPPVVEEGIESYRANAILKARAFQAWSGLAALGDDTGLEIAALRGAPGVISARYAGPGADAAANTAKVLAAMAGQPDRTARFRCALVLATPDDRLFEATGDLCGEIAVSPRGSGGFGYDSIFVVAGFGKTLAELKEDAPRELTTHRQAALDALVEALRGSGLT